MSALAVLSLSLHCIMCRQVKIRYSESNNAKRQVKSAIGHGTVKWNNWNINSIQSGRVGQFQKCEFYIIEISSEFFFCMFLFHISFISLIRLTVCSMLFIEYSLSLSLVLDMYTLCEYLCSQSANKIDD